ncbi:ATPase/histidine kinase/DNA gyrase B/HSP90 domain protein [Ostertagia ostertagi]
MRFKYASMAVSDIIWELDMELMKCDLFQGKKQLFDLEGSIGEPPCILGDLVLPGDRSKIQDSFHSAAADSNCSLWSAEYHVYSRKREIRDIVNNCIFVRDKQGKVHKAIGAITDITEKKQLIAELYDQQEREHLRVTAATLQVQEAERTSIGQELHDNVNQLLAGTKMLLTTLIKQNEKANGVLNDCVLYLTQATEANRKIAQAFVTPDFSDADLISQLKHLTNIMFKSTGVEVVIEASAAFEKLLNDEQRLALYRIAQEQCTNISKYANASEVRIRFTILSGQVVLTISDNGIGAVESKYAGGIGLTNIKNRLLLLGGSLKIDTSEGAGFQLTVQFPAGQTKSALK